MSRVFARPIAIAIVALSISFGGVRDADAQAQAQLPEFPTVSTFAGSGEAGIRDGLATQAQFVFPTGVATDRHGNVFVADAGAQRIRMIAPNGIVSTVAGGGELYANRTWVDGAYADGPAATARFFVPYAIAVDANDTLYIADAEHHCIRTIRAGTVATFAGDCATAGDREGPREQSLFSRPVGIAVDRGGDVYVADLIDGVREIARDGTVRALDVPVHNPGAIALFENEDGLTYAVADPQGIVVVHPGEKPVRLTLLPSETLANFRAVAPLGYPTGLVLCGEWKIVYTDARTHTIRYYDKQDTRVLAGAAYDDVENDGGGYRDGIGASAEFDAPLGIAAASDGSFIVADSNNHRLRRVSPFDTRSASDPLFHEIPRFDPRDYNVLIVGNSFAWFDTDYQTSIAGQIERALRGIHAGGKRIVVSTVSSRGLSLTGISDLVASELGDLHPDFTILLLNSGFFSSTFPDTLADGKHNAEVVRQSSTLLARVKAALPGAGNVLAVVHPWPWELAGAESTYHRFYEKIGAEWIVPVPSFHQMLLDVNVNAAIPVLDMWPIFWSHEARGDHRAYFGSENPHFTTAGRALVGASIADYLTEKHPWNVSP